MKRVFLVLISLVLLVLALTGCVPSNTTNTTITETTSITSSILETPKLTPQSGGILRIVPRIVSQVFGYPGDMANSAAVDVSSPCLEALCGVDTNGEFMPTKLTTAYQVAPDGKSIVFTLRKDVKFHDGTDFNAVAAKWNLEQMKKVRIPGTDSWTSEIDVVDDHTVRINLKQYQNTFIGQLASISRISSPSAFEKFGIAKIHTYPVGTGPFKFLSFTPDVGIKWERNDEYWGSKPYLDGIETLFISDDMARSAALQSKGVDILFNITSETGIGLREKGYKVTVGGQETLVVLYPDSANVDSPLSQLEVRQAIEYSLDKSALSQLGNGFWIPAFQPSTPNTPGFVTDFKGRQYDPEKAKQLLEDAGYPNGFKVNMIIGTTPNTTPMDTMTAVQQYLSKVGITTDLQPMSGDQRNQISLNGWHDGFIPSGIFSSLNYLSGIQYNLAPGGNVHISTARPSGLDELLTQAASAKDMVTAAQFYQKIDMLLYDHATIIPLWVSPQQLYAEQTYVYDSGLFSTGAIFEWTPEKAWLSK